MCPCWQIQTISIEFKTKHKELLKKALKNEEIGFYESRNKLYISGDRLILDLDRQEASVIDNDYTLLNKIKVAYSETAIREIARKKNWALKKIGNGKLRARRY